MKLYEFFSQQPFSTPDAPKKEEYKTDSNEQKHRLEDDVYWHMLDDSYLNKKYFMPLAHKIKIKMNNNTYDSTDFIMCWMPMVKSACLHFYRTNEMRGDIKKIFDKNMRIDLCKRLSIQFQEDIKNDSYKLGD